jgi:hypothetical protein
MLVAGLVVASLGLAGCAAELTEEDKRAAAEYESHERDAPHGGEPATSTSRMPSTYMTWRQLASVIGCEAKLQGKAADMRHAVCAKDGDTFVMLDFDTAKGQRDWLDYATLYGGVYLVGERWVLSGRSKEYMESLRPELGGNIEESTEHGSS